MRARVAHDVERHEGRAGEMHDGQLELLNLWAHCEEAARARAGESGAGLA